MVAELRAAEMLPARGRPEPPAASSQGEAARDPGAGAPPKRLSRRTGNAPSPARRAGEPAVIDWRGFHVALRNAALAAMQSGTPLSLIMLEFLPEAAGVRLSQRAPAGRRIEALATDIARDLHPMSALARYGEERLAMILMGADLPTAILEAERIGRNLPSTDRDDTASGAAIGVAQFRDDESLGHLIERVTAAVGRGKHDGRQVTVAERRWRRRSSRPIDRAAKLCSCELRAACVCGTI